MEEDIDTAIKSGEELGNNLENALADLEAEKTLVEAAQRDKSEALRKLGLSQEKSTSDVQCFRLAGEKLRKETEEGNEKVKLLQADNAHAILSSKVTSS